jgi:GDP-L-fucose synthase
MNKIIITGGTGLVGSALQSIQMQYSDYVFVFLSSKDCDLTNYNDTLECFWIHSPKFVIHLAANVGGLYKNMHHRVDMFEINLQMNMNVLKVCHELGVEKVVSCLSTCIFPDNATYPIHEDMLHDGAPHPSNSTYAYAKRMLEVQSRAYQEQYGDNFICVIPTNIYGENDNYDLENGHVVPSLIHKCHNAKNTNTPFIVRGTGAPLRQFIYSKDLAELLMWVLSHYAERDSIILSVGEKEEISIHKVATMIAKNYNYEDMLVFDDSFSDGQFKKTADNGKLMRLHPEVEFTSIEVGIRNSVEWFKTHLDACRRGGREK